MKKGKKIILIVAAGIVGIIVIIGILKFTGNTQIVSEIPEVSGIENLSKPVQEQITEAFITARENPTAENLGRLGMVYHSSANYNEAAQCYSLAIKKDNSDWKWIYLSGYLQKELGNSEAAIEDFSKVIRINPKAFHAWYYLGQEYKNLRNNKKAEEAFKKIVNSGGSHSSGEKNTRQDNFPLSAYAGFELARMYYDNGQIDEAEETLKVLIQNNNLFGAAYRLLGNIYSMKGDLSLSEKYTARAGDLVLFSPPVDTLIDRLALISRSEFYLLKKIDEAEDNVYSKWALKLVRHSLKYISENRYLVSKAIAIYVWNGLYDEASALVNEHINLFQDSFNELNKTGLLFFHKGLYPQAISYWNKALELEPNDIEVRKNIAICYWGVGEKEKAQNILIDLLDTEKGDPDKLSEVVYVLYHFGSKKEALTYHEKFKRLIPENPALLKLSAEIAQSKGNNKEAIKLYKASFEGNPEDLKVLEYLGNLLNKLSMWEEYIAVYKKALEYHPNKPELLETLGNFLINCPDPSYRDINRGMEYSERAFTHIACQPATMYNSGRNLAIAYAMQGEKQKAISTISQVINFGRRENIPKAMQDDLENLLRTFRRLGN